MLARAVARVFHGIGSVSFPAAKWRDSAFWARYRHHAFREVSHVVLLLPPPPLARLGAP